VSVAKLFLAHVASSICLATKTAEHQITRGGPVILFQLENEYSGYLPPATEDFEYERILLEQTVRISGHWGRKALLNVDVYREDMESSSLSRPTMSRPQVASPASMYTVRYTLIPTSV